jgi:hypothetical protein
MIKLKLFILSLLVAGCASHKAPVTAKGKSAAEAMVMQAMYENYDGSTSILLPDSKAAMSYQKFRPGLYVLPGDEIVCKPAQWLDLGSSSAMMITSCNSSIGADCPACAPVMGVAFLNKNKQGEWVREGIKPFVMSLGGNGRLPEATPTQLGKNSWAVIFDSVKHLQGTTETTRTLFTANKEFKEILSYTLSGNNRGSCGPRTEFPCYSYETTFKTSADSEGMGPIRMHKTGTEPIKDNPKLIFPVDRHMKFCYTGVRYERPCPN